MHIQTIVKKIRLNEDWKENNYQGYSDYIYQVTQANKSLAAIMNSNVLDVLSIDLDIKVTVREKETEKRGDSLDTSFWLDVATENYIDD